MDRDVAIQQLNKLQGQDLHKLASQYGVTIKTPKGTVDKGWVGKTCEGFLGLSSNSLQSPDFGDWELKTIPIKSLKNGKLSFKETMAVTMMNPEDVVNTPFEDSHLLAKLKSLVVVSRTVGKTNDDPTSFYSATAFDLPDDLYQIIKADYELVQDTIKNKGFSSLTGKMGKYIQPRTKGSKGSTSRAFYARPQFLKLFIDLD